MEREEERGGEERGREAMRAGVTGSQRASRSGLLSRGTGVMSAAGGSHTPFTPGEEGRKDGNKEVKNDKRQK